MPGLPNEPTTAPRAGGPLHEFMTKVLGQLSASAWLPAAFLVAGGWLILALRANNADLARAFESMGAAGWPELLLLFVVVIATTLVQAFSFDAIRLLEGYWGDGPLSRIIGNRMCMRHRWRRNRLEQAHHQLQCRAYDSAEKITSFYGFAHEDYWWELANPDDIRRMHTLRASLENYPLHDYLFRPTKLGNLLVAYEERAFGSPEGHGERIESRIFNRVPPNVQAEVDEQKRRLEVHCTLVFVSAVLGTLSLVALWPYGLPGVAGMGLGLAGSWLFYRAAITSAGGYGSALLVRMTYLNQPQAAQPESQEVSPDDGD